MEVDHDAKAHVVGPRRHGYHIGLAAPASSRIHPNPQANGVDAFSLEDRQAVLLYPGVVEELDALGFHLGQPAYVRTPGKGRGESASRNRQNKKHKNETGYIFSGDF